MDSVPVTLLSEIPVSSNSVNLEHVADIAEVTGARVEQSAADSLQSQTSTFSSLGKLCCVIVHDKHCCADNRTIRLIGVSH